MLHTRLLIFRNGWNAGQIPLSYVTNKSVNSVTAHDGVFVSEKAEKWTGHHRLGISFYCSEVNHSILEGEPHQFEHFLRLESDLETTRCASSDTTGAWNHYPNVSSKKKKKQISTKQMSAKPKQANTLSQLWFVISHSWRVHQNMAVWCRLQHPFQNLQSLKIKLYHYVPLTPLPTGNFQSHPTTRISPKK